MNKKIKDRISLIATGLSIFVFGLPLYIFVNKHFSEEWTLFIFMSLGYIIAVISLPFSSSRLLTLSKYKIIIFQTVMSLITVGLAALAFKFRLLPMPRNGSPYFIAMICLGTATTVFLEYCSKRWNFLKQ